MIYNTERPYRFDSMVGQTNVVENIREQSKKNKFFHSYLFVGQWGGGKTTMARILAAAVNCDYKDGKGNPCGECDSCKAVFSGNHPDVVELDAIRAVIGGSGAKPAINSTKSQTGHMVGATGAAEVIFSSIMLEKEFISSIRCNASARAAR